MDTNSHRYRDMGGGVIKMYVGSLGRVVNEESTDNNRQQIIDSLGLSEKIREINNLISALSPFHMTGDFQNTWRTRLNKFIDKLTGNRDADDSVIEYIEAIHGKLSDVMANNISHLIIDKIIERFSQNLTKDEIALFEKNGLDREWIDLKELSYDSEELSEIIREKGYKEILDLANKMDKKYTDEYIRTDVKAKIQELMPKPSSPPKPSDDESQSKLNLAIKEVEKYKHAISPRYYDYLLEDIQDMVEDNRIDNLKQKIDTLINKGLTRTIDYELNPGIGEIEDTKPYKYGFKLATPEEVEKIHKCNAVFDSVMRPAEFYEFKNSITRENLVKNGYQYYKGKLAEYMNLAKSIDYSKVITVPPEKQQPEQPKPQEQQPAAEEQAKSVAKVVNGDKQQQPPKRNLVDLSLADYDKQHKSRGTAAEEAHKKAAAEAKQKSGIAKLWAMAKNAVNRGRDAVAGLIDKLNTWLKKIQAKIYQEGQSGFLTTIKKTVVNIIEWLTRKAHNVIQKYRGNITDNVYYQKDGKLYDRGKEVKHEHTRTYGFLTEDNFSCFDSTHRYLDETYNIYDVDRVMIEMIY